MTYNINESFTGPYLVYLKASSTAISSGSVVPYSIVEETPGSGITVSNGRITLPWGNGFVTQALKKLV